MGFPDTRIMSMSFEKDPTTQPQTAQYGAMAYNSLHRLYDALVRERRMVEAEEVLSMCLRVKTIARCPIAPNSGSES